MNKETRKQVRRLRALALESAEDARWCVRHAATRFPGERDLWNAAIAERIWRALTYRAQARELSAGAKVTA